MQTERETGVIERWNDDRGFGFVRRDGAPSGRALFIHISQIERNGSRPEVSLGDRIEFAIGQNDKGPCVVEAILI